MKKMSSKLYKFIYKNIFDKKNSIEFNKRLENLSRLNFIDDNVAYIFHKKFDFKINLKNLIEKTINSDSISNIDHEIKNKFINKDINSMSNEEIKLILKEIISNAINNFSFGVFAKSKSDNEKEQIFNEILELKEKLKEGMSIKEKELDFNISSLSRYN